MEKNSKKKKILLGCFAVILVVLLVSVGIALYVLASVFDDKPAKAVVKVPDVKALDSAMDKLKNTLEGGGAVSGNTNLENVDLNALGLGGIDAANIDPNNMEDLGNLLQNIDLGKVLGALAKPGSLTLTKAEVNALIASGFTADMVGNFQDSEKPGIYDAWFENGRFTVKFTVDSNIPTPFGSYCNIEVVFVPQVIEHHLKLDLCSAKLGDLNCPVSYLKGSLDAWLSSYEQSKDGKHILGMINSLKVEDKKVVLEYDFQELAMFLLEKQNDMQLLNNSSELSVDEIMKIFQ